MLKEKGMDIVRYFTTPCPSLFDLCAVLGVVGMGFINPAWQGFYFCLYAVFVAVIGFSQENERNVNVPSLTLLSLIALAGIFSHGFLSGPNSITFQHLNFMLMFEGFGYVFFGALLFYTLVNKGSNLKLFYITLPIALLWTIKTFIYSGRGSVVFALAIALIIYLIVHKKLWFVLLVTVFAFAFFIVNREWFVMKFACRIPIWKDMIFSRLQFPPIGIIQHPFMGHGFNQLLIPDNIMCSNTWGKTWLFKHNDYLNVINILGVFVIIPIVMFMKQIISTVKESGYLIPVLTIAILMFVQMTIMTGDRALAITSFLALAYVEKAI
jgi:hypothetical protein